MRLLVCLLLCPAALAASNFNCPSNENTGYFADPDECDKYWDCDRGVATPQFCDDGMAFSERARRSSNPCVNHWLADCFDKTLQEPKGTFPCIRQNGYFPHEDPENCVKYYQCVANRPTLTTCNPGLVYNIQTRSCDWIQNAGRTNCNTKISVQGFTCPSDLYADQNRLNEQHPRFNDENDCRSFYVCLNGVTPQQSKCTLGEVFSDQLKSCTLAEFVPGCEDYYRDHPLRDRFTDEDGDGRVDINLEAINRF